MSAPKWQPGDVLACAGTSLVSRAIALGTCQWHQLFRGEWFSHVAIVAPNIGVLKVWESTSQSTLPCDIQRKMVSGVQAHSPQHWLDAYQGKVWRLRMHEDRKLTPRQAIGLGDWLLSKIGRPYDFTGAARAGLPHWVKRLFWRAPNGDSYFCDELVAEALQARHLPLVFNPSRITPAWLARELVDINLYQPWERIK